MLAAYRDDAYKIVLTLHILCAIVGFGAVFLNGIYFAQAKSRRGAEGLAISEANLLVSKVGQYFIYAVFVLGIVLVLLGDEVVEFGQTWVWLSIVLYVGALGISHGLLLPRVHRHLALQRELVLGPPAATAAGPASHDAELEVLGGRIAMFGSILNVTLIVLLALMIFKPGGA
jgi:uncharacterized membrane protein